MAKDKLKVIVDTAVILDFVKVDLKIITKITKKFDLYVTSKTIKEVQDISSKTMAKIGFKKINFELEQYQEAVGLVGSTSEEDNLCMIVARDNEIAVATNDKRLRNLCIEKKVNVYWGLEILKMTIKSGIITRREGIYIAKKIKEINLRITDAIIQGFIDSL